VAVALLAWAKVMVTQAVGLGGGRGAGGGDGANIHLGFISM
jgi:hypothetical protein